MTMTAHSSNSAIFVRSTSPIYGGSRRSEGMRSKNCVTFSDDGRGSPVVESSSASECCSVGSSSDVASLTSSLLAQLDLGDRGAVSRYIIMLIGPEAVVAVPMQ